MKTKRLFAMIAAATCLACCIGTATACVEKNEPEDATYTATYTLADTAKYGYIQGLNACDTTVTLDLDADSTFKLTKTMKYATKPDEPGYYEGNATIQGTAEFTGTYKKVGADVTLSAATTATYSFDWGMMAYLQYSEPNSASETDETTDKAFSMFNHWSLNTNGNSEQKLTVDATTKTLTYVSNDVYTAPKGEGTVSYTFASGDGMKIECYENKKLNFYRPTFHEVLTGTWEIDGDGYMTVTIAGVDYYPEKNADGKYEFSGYKYGMGMAERDIKFTQQ